MSGAFAVIIEGFTDMRDFGEIKDDIRLIQQQTINKTADNARTRSANEIRRTVNFPANYLNPSEKRLFVAQYATAGQLEARVRARVRATSLARFVTSAKPVNQPGVIVQVHPGKARQLKRAFLIKLRAGSDVDTLNNTGLAVRLRPGEVLRNKTNSVKVASNLYLLYGPSVQQVFMANDGSGVAQDLTPQIEQFMTDEFYRLWEVRRGR